MGNSPFQLPAASSRSSNQGPSWAVSWSTHFSESVVRGVEANGAAGEEEGEVLWRAGSGRAQSHLSQGHWPVS